MVTTINHAVPPDRCRLDMWFWRTIEGLGLEPTSVLKRARVQVSPPLATHCFFTTAELFAIFDALGQLTGDASIGLKFFLASMKMGSPAWFAAASHAADYRHALAHVIKFKGYCMPERMHLQERDGEVSILKEWFYAEPESRILVDSSFAFLLELGRQGTGRHITPLRVEFARQGRSSEAHREHFGCQIHHEAHRDALVLRSSDLDLPFTAHNPELLDILTPALTTAFEDRHPFDSFADVVKAELKRSLPTGRPDLTGVARAMGTSERTLQRRITAEGKTFSGIVQEARRELGRRLLLDPSVDVGEVAGLLGYQDTTSFYRAFRIWEGVTPNHWRELNASEGQSAS